MTILIDQTLTHDSDNTGNNTVPPGITGLSWCHLASGAAPREGLGAGSLDELEAFLTDNFSTIGCSTANIRTPALGSNVTYCGLSEAQRTAAIAAGAKAQRLTYIIEHVFDAQDPSSTYEP
ncbi:MAG TPA: hypothetical protein VFD36_00460 [Kofleriaceae bacterium]|nr:hypothetical protein [Kofleriaceae bacterium]